MLATHVDPTLPRSRPSAPLSNLYTRVGIETGLSGASPHRLVEMLFTGFADAVAQAKGALLSGQVELKCNAVGRATRIVDEGLKAGLDVAGGGALAADLAELYAYITRRLVHANLKNDMAALDECLALMQPLSKAWSSIAAQVDGPRG
jgi:flagellar protein FliS